MQIYEVQPHTDHRGFDLISDALPFGRLRYGEPNVISNAIGYAEHPSRSHLESHINAGVADRECRRAPRS